ncbi:MAG: 16S rRNA (guanine(966)-N(2))-methyltransferase RsmD [Alphaproteobacteria bacterium]|nr:16S rRNA (guanine(966)-N(2))-methyltransferase RsmD [Alphaproteobacteria bacterium]
MRIISGINKGQKLLSPQINSIRPTSDRIRESIFNIITYIKKPDDSPFLLEGSNVLDCFAGTGALGFEALSRGAYSLTCLENDKNSCELIYKNALKLSQEQKTFIYHYDASHIGDSTLNPINPYNLVFMDPPYKKGHLIGPTLQGLYKKSWLALFSLIIIETHKNEKINWPLHFSVSKEKIYGQTKIIFLYLTIK